MFRLDGWRLPVRRAAMVVAAALLMAACGGGEQVKRFVPARVLSFGDENSAIGPTGLKYTVNGLTSPTDGSQPVVDCNLSPIWVQALATAYNVPFNCANGATTGPSRTFATVNATVTAVAAQIDGFLASNTFQPDDLVTLMAGTHDILAIGARVIAGSISQAQAVAEAEQAGTELAGQVNRMAAAGAKVLISTVPDVALTPIGRADATGTLHLLSQRFNAKLRTGLVNDGRMIGLVLFDEQVQGFVNTGAANTTDRACDDAHIGDTDTAVLLTCTSSTLRVLSDGTTASLGTFVWADGLRLAPLGHSTLGSLAFSRASNNPF